MEEAKEQRKKETNESHVKNSARIFRLLYSQWFLVVYLKGNGV